jgi:hypothetical protein
MPSPEYSFVVETGMQLEMPIECREESSDSSPGLQPWVDDFFICLAL